MGHAGGEGILATCPRRAGDGGATIWPSAAVVATAREVRPVPVRAMPRRARRFGAPRLGPFAAPRGRGLL